MWCNTFQPTPTQVNKMCKIIHLCIIILSFNGVPIVTHFSIADSETDTLRIAWCWIENLGKSHHVELPASAVSENKSGSTCLSLRAPLSWLLSWVGFHTVPVTTEFTVQCRGFISKFYASYIKDHENNWKSVFQFFPPTHHVLVRLSPDLASSRLEGNMGWNEYTK